MALSPVSYRVIIGTGPVCAYADFGAGVVGLTAARDYARAEIAAGRVARVVSVKE